jgi:hypothetical protein
MDVSLSNKSYIFIDKLLHIRTYPRSLMIEVVYQFSGIDKPVLSNKTK